MTLNLAERVRKAESEYYPTPATATIPLLQWLARIGVDALIVDWFDPCCGDGALLACVLGSDNEVSGIELQPELAKLAKKRLGWWVKIESRSALVEGFGTLGADSWAPCAVIQNPPFSLVGEFIVAGHQHARSHAVICATLSRVGVWHAGRMRLVGRPDAMLALTWRPKFVAGATDRYDYAWSVYLPSWLKSWDGCRWERLLPATRFCEGKGDAR